MEGGGGLKTPRVNEGPVVNQFHKAKWKRLCRGLNGAEVMVSPKMPLGHPSLYHCMQTYPYIASSMRFKRVFHAYPYFTHTHRVLRRQKDDALSGTTGKALLNE